jgi:hypothetical protein
MIYPKHRQRLGQFAGAYPVANDAQIRQPTSGDSLFFVAKKDGTHAFARTYEKHKNNIRKYLK